MTSIITDAFTQDHHTCDHHLAAAEKSLTSDDWTHINHAAQMLITSVNQHFDVEEQTLFPRLANRYHVAANPIAVMCSEHAQMRALLDELNTAVIERDRTACQGVLETLHFLTQQHNAKEEAVLYPMADGALREQANEIAGLVTHEH